MPKIVLTADVHLGFPNKLDDVLYSLRAIRQHMQENSIDYCIIMGDLFHVRDGTATDVTHRSYEFFKETKEIYNQSWAVFPGNHDMFLRNSWKIHSLKMLSDVLDVYDKPCTISIGGSRFWILPFIHDEEIYMQAVARIAKQSQPGDVLLTHIGVTGAKLNECFLHKNWNIVTFDNFPLAVYSGHFHCSQQVGKLWYPGSPIPFSFAEGLVEHGFFVYDTEKATHEFIKTYSILKGELHPPDYPTVLDTDINNLTSENVVGNKVRIVPSHVYTTDERVVLRQKLLEMGASDVTWQKFKEGEVNIAEAGKTDGLSLGDPELLLKTWFDLDKPDHVNYPMLSVLNKEIVVEGNEKLIERGMTAEED